jgi:hypothetical protein
MPSRDKLAESTASCAKHITGDEKGEAQIFLDHLFQAFGHAGGLKEAGATLEMRVSKADGGGTSFADLVWKPIVLIEMKKRGGNLQRHYQRGADCWAGKPPVTAFNRQAAGSETGHSFAPTRHRWPPAVRSPSSVTETDNANTGFKSGYHRD